MVVGKHAVGDTVLLEQIDGRGHGHAAGVVALP
jgi:hypothetical protein